MMMIKRNSSSSRRCFFYSFLVVWLLLLQGQDASTKHDDFNDNGEPHGFHSHAPKLGSWSNSVGIGGKFEKLFLPSNGGRRELQEEEFLSGISELKDIMGQAEASGKRLRAFGSRYSSTQIWYNEEWLVDSGGLNYLQAGFDDSTHLTAAYQAKSDVLVFIQSGVRTKPLNLALFEKGLALQTSTATDGQRIVGAAMTASHGSNSLVGGHQDTIRAVHVVVSSTESVLIQRQSDPVVTAAYAATMDGATLMADDAMFNSIITSFGNYGLIHGVIIEVEPLYKLRGEVVRITEDTAFDILRDYDLSRIGLSSFPLHFEMSFNPYTTNKKSVFVRYFEKVALTRTELDQVQRERAAPLPTPGGKDVYAAMGDVFSRSVLAFFVIPQKILYGFGLNVVLSSFLGEKMGVREQFPHEIFQTEESDQKSSPSPISLTGSEIGCTPNDAIRVVEIIQDIVKTHPIAASISLRFVKRSEATMAHTNRVVTDTSLPPFVQGLNTAIEMPGPYGRFLFTKTHKTHQMIFDALAASNIDHAYHWGQHFPENDEWVSNSFGSGLTEFQTQRDLLLGSNTALFTNDLMQVLAI